MSTDKTRAHYEAMAVEAANGGPAFPLITGQRQIGPHEFEYDIAHGMSLRDYFAAKAMQALIHSGAEILRHTAEGTLSIPARVGIPPLAYEYADAMLKAREVQS